jgi:signal transduction histidine kinase
MTRWFQRLPVHRKLTVLALFVSAFALAVAMLGLSVIDLWRYRVTAGDDAQALARIVAENAAAGVAFGDPDDVRQTLSAVRVRGEVTHACVYGVDGTLFAGYSRDAGCPPQAPSSLGWSRVAGFAPITRNEQFYGTVYVERQLSDLRRRLLLTSLAGIVMLLGAALAAYLLATRVHGAVSGPLGELAQAARRFGHDPSADVPAIDTSPDEIGDLVSSFREMAGRVRAANDELRESNEALRRENEERRRMEQEREAALRREQEASRLKDEFLAAVSHEIRTPLNAIAGWAQVLGAGVDDEATRRRAVNAIIRNVHAQTRVINDLIDISRSVTGKLRLTFTRVDMRQVALAAAESIQPTAQAKGVRLITTLPHQPAEVSGDRDRLQQVLWNLLSNAVKFTPASGTVTLELTRRAGLVRTSVTDSGIGIASEFLPHVFERFRQADGSMTREHGGLGLGLSIARDLTELHGGTLEAASDGRGTGAMFTVSLPEASALDVVSAPAAARGDGLPSLDGLRILAVDDNVDALDVMSAALVAAGAAVHVVSSGAAAVEMWAAGGSDVLVCDLAMPHVSGFDVIAQVRALDDRQGRATRAVAVSAHASEQVRTRCESAGFAQHVSKPFDAAALVRAVAVAAGRA